MPRQPIAVNYLEKTKCLLFDLISVSLYKVLYSFAALKCQHAFKRSLPIQCDFGCFKPAIKFPFATKFRNTQIFNFFDG